MVRRVRRYTIIRRQRWYNMVTQSWLYRYLRAFVWRRLHSPENLTRRGAAGAVRDLERVHEVVRARGVKDPIRRFAVQGNEYNIIMYV